MKEDEAEGPHQGAFHWTYLTRQIFGRPNRCSQDASSGSLVIWPEEGSVIVLRRPAASSRHLPIVVSTQSRAWYWPSGLRVRAALSPPPALFVRLPHNRQPNCRAHSP